MTLSNNKDDDEEFKEKEEINDKNSDKAIKLNIDLVNDKIDEISIKPIIETEEEQEITNKKNNIPKHPNHNLYAEINKPSNNSTLNNKDVILTDTSEENEIEITKKEKPNIKSQIVELVEERKTPHIRNRSEYIKDNNYNEIINISVNNPETVINISNINVSQNYNSLFNTIKNASDNVLFGDT